METKKINHKILSLDLEMNQPSGLVIQIGAVVGDLFTGAVHERFNRFVHPGEAINPEITKLTKISNDTIRQKGVPLAQAAQELKDFMAKNDCIIIPASWGRDGAYLQEQLNNHGINLTLFGYDDEFNVKKMYQIRRMQDGKSMQGGVASAIKYLGHNFSGTKHNAMDDAFNTFLILHELVKGWGGKK